MDLTAGDLAEHRGRPRGNDSGPVRGPLTFQAIIIWRDELMNAKILLLSGCTDPSSTQSARLDSVRPGMTRDHVLEIMGPSLHRKPERLLLREQET